MKKRQKDCLRKSYRQLRKVKGKGEKKKYTYLKAEFQRTARRDKKTSLCLDQCKEIEENNTMEKTRDFQENQTYQGDISCKDGYNKEQKWYRPKETEDIKKRWQEYKELYKKDLNDPDNHSGVITQIESDIWECEAKWALGSITMNKASRCDRIPAELLQILKR